MFGIILDLNMFNYNSMRILLALFITNFCFIVAKAQQNGVKLIEEKTAKRHFIYAENTTNENRSVFLKVMPKGYRRRANRPIIKKTPPKSKVLLVTLIPLKDSVPSYKLIFTASKEPQNIKATKFKSTDYYE